MAGNGQCGKAREGQPSKGNGQLERDHADHPAQQAGQAKGADAGHAMPLGSGALVPAALCADE